MAMEDQILLLTWHLVRSLIYILEASSILAPCVIVSSIILGLFIAYLKRNKMIEDAINEEYIAMQVEIIKRSGIKDIKIVNSFNSGGINGTENKNLKELL